MSKLVNAIKAGTNVARTENGAVTHKTTLSNVVDLFFVAGASRGKDLSAAFAKSFKEDEDLSIRLAQWLRDAREGAGEREQFRNLFKWTIQNDPAAATAMLSKIPLVGRWDDVLVALGTSIEADAVRMIKAALNAGDGLCAKWMPRKGAEAARLRSLLGYTPKQYRKTLVALTKVVETAMCAKDWEGINYSHVPSVAFSRYKKAFNKHSPERFAGFITKVEKGEAKINASAIFPHDIIRSLRVSRNATVEQASNLQWKALPNFLEGSNENILVMCDSSGSMGGGMPFGGTQPIDVAIALSIYMSERMGGIFKDTFLTFSARPTLQTLSGSLKNRIEQLERAQWDMNTNLQAAFDLILDMAVKHKLSQADLPTKILIVSDMEFDQCGGRTNFQASIEKFKRAGYTAPDIVFWNVRGRIGNAPVTMHQSGAALVSGFSPSIVQSVLGQKQITPMDVMLKTLLSDRYDY
jgi:hypothetical protein